MFLQWLQCMRPAFMRSIVFALIDSPKLVNQLLGLERRTARGGKDSIDHALGQHDDIANAVAGGAAQLCVVKGVYDTSYRWVSYDDDPDGAEACRRTRLQASLLSGAGAVMTAKAL